MRACQGQEQRQDKDKDKDKDRAEGGKKKVEDRWAEGGDASLAEGGGWW